MRILYCGRESGPPNVPFVRLLRGPSLFFPTFVPAGPTDAPVLVNGGDYRFGDVSKTAHAIGGLIEGRIVNEIAHDDCWLLDLGACPPNSPAGHAYMATVIDSIRSQVGRIRVGLLDTTLCADLCDFVAPDLSPIAPVCAAPGPNWCSFEAYRKAAAARLVAAAETKKPIMGVIGAHYNRPGPLYRRPIGEAELSMAVDFCASAGGALAIMDEPSIAEASDLSTVLRRAAGIADAAARLPS